MVVKERKVSLVEKIGRRLPEANILFMLMIVGTLILSAILAGSYYKVTGDQTTPKVVGENAYEVVNMLKPTNFRWIFEMFINNFRSYPPLGVVIVGVIGFGFAEKVGLLGTLIKKLGFSTPEKVILPIIIFIGVNSSIASDAGYIVLIPLAGALYAGLGKNPLVGIAAAFAAVSAGFGAALIPTPGDGLLGEITARVALQNDIEFLLNPVTQNLIFMIASTFFLTALITFITKYFIEGKVSHFEIVIPEEDRIEIGELTSEEVKGLKSAGVALVITILVLVFLYFVGVLKTYTPADPNFPVVVHPLPNGTVNPILNNIIVIMVLLFLFPSLAYARATGQIKNSKDYTALNVNAMKSMAYIMVFAIFAGNFLALFNYSGIAQFIANHGAQLLLDLQLNNKYLLLIGFIIISALINLFMGSASAKWTLLAPIFIPLMFFASHEQLSVEVVQAAYRVADSSTNVISPLMTYIGVILLFAKKYSPKFELGDLIALMMPYSIGILLGWSAFFIIWLSLGLPFGL